MSKHHQWGRVGATFITAVTLTIGLLHGGRALATHLTVSARGCIQQNGTYVNTIWCNIPGGSDVSAPATTGLDVAYFDYRLAVPTDVTIALYKQTLGGVIYMDYKTTVNEGTGTHDTPLTASKVNTNSVVWDYYYARIAAKDMQSMSSFYGVAVRTK
jgi:hypothetical protein